MVNEPPSGQSPTMKMTTSYAYFVSADDPLMIKEKLSQSAGAEAAWRAHVRQPLGAAAVGDEPWRRSERMVLYMGTRHSFPLEQELTVDYGKDYARDYDSGSHKAHFTPLQYPYCGSNPGPSLS